MNYILKKKETGCLFCKKLLEKKDRENLILFRGTQAFVMMNKFPYTNGHLMVVPNVHCFDLEELGRKETGGLFHLLAIATSVLKESLHPHGFNIGINIGKAGGAGESHLHVHLVPRWAGDTNFMPVLGETKIVPQYLDETYQALWHAFRQRSGRKRKGGKA
jgi:ATP adenylyltransferase